MDALQGSKGKRTIAKRQKEGFRMGAFTNAELKEIVTAHFVNMSKNDATAFAKELRKAATKAKDERLEVLAKMETSDKESDKVSKLTDGSHDAEITLRGNGNKGRVIVLKFGTFTVEEIVKVSKDDTEETVKVIVYRDRCGFHTNALSIVRPLFVEKVPAVA